MSFRSKFVTATFVKYMEMSHTELLHYIMTSEFGEDYHQSLDFYENVRNKHES